MDIETCRRIYKDSRDGLLLPAASARTLSRTGRDAGPRRRSWAVPDHIEVPYDAPGVSEDVMIVVHKDAVVHG